MVPNSKLIKEKRRMSTSTNWRELEHRIVKVIKIGARASGGGVP
jgi:hypothetical protein